MNVTLQAAGVKDASRVSRLVAQYHAFEGIAKSAADRRTALAPLLRKNNLGKIWFIQNDGAVIGYIAVCFGYSIEFGGRDAFVDELFILGPHRGRGIGHLVLEEVCRAATALGVKMLHLEVAKDNTRAQKLYRSAGFKPRAKFFLMSRPLAGRG